MLMFLLSLLFVAVVFSIGAGVARAISSIPLSILLRAADGGRYSQLGLRDPPAPPTTRAGRRAAPMHGQVLRPAGVLVG
jgi:hypothetical protein